MGHRKQPSSNANWWDKYIVSIRAVPVDAVITIGYVFVAALATLGLGDQVAVRAFLGVPLLLFLPGYALVSVLFPQRSKVNANALSWGTNEERTNRFQMMRARGVTWTERLLFSFGASIALLPILGLLLSISGLGYSAEIVVATVGGFILVATVAGIVRREQLPQGEQYRLPYREWGGQLRGAVFDQDTRLDAVLNLAVILLAVLAVTGLGYAAFVPGQSASFTSVSLLTESEDGQMVAGDYPGTLDSEGEEVVIEVTNHEGREVQYTVVAELQRVEESGGELEVLQRAGLGEMTETVAPGETWRKRHVASPELSGGNLRLVYYVYRGDAPDTPTTEGAYRSVHLWVDAPINVQS